MGAAAQKPQEMPYGRAIAESKVAVAIHDLKVIKSTTKGAKASVEQAIAKSADIKKHRTRTDINNMLDHLLEQVPAGLFSRAMAWCSGEILTSEFEADMKAYADENDKPYISLKDKEY